MLKLKPKILMVCRPNLPVTAFIERYVKRCRRMRQERVNRLRAVGKLFSVFLRRQAVVADVQPEPIAGFVEWWARLNRFKSIRNFTREVRGLLRALRCVPDGRATGSGKPKRVLSSEPGTLWSICLEYFQKNRRIRTEK